MSPKHIRLEDLPPLRIGFDPPTLAGYEATYPFATQEAAKAACPHDHEVVGVLSYFDAAGSYVKQAITTYPGPRKPADTVGTPVRRFYIRPKQGHSAPVAARAASRGTPRYVELLQMLRAGPVTIDEVVNKWGCSRAAASSLFSDVKNKTGANLARESDTYQLEGH